MLKLPSRASWYQNPPPPPKAAQLPGPQTQSFKSDLVSHDAQGLEVEDHCHRSRDPWLGPLTNSLSEEFQRETKHFPKFHILPAIVLVFCHCCNIATHLLTSTKQMYFLTLFYKKSPTRVSQGLRCWQALFLSGDSWREFISWSFDIKRI